jgi:hypothetical protein
LAVIAALAAGCGSTVQQSESAVGVAPNGVVSSSGTTSGDSALSVPTGGTASGPGVNTAAGAGGPVTATGTAAGGGTTPAGSGTTSGSGKSSNAGGDPAVAAPGITDSTVYLGFEYSSSAAAADRAIGAAGAAPTYDFRDVLNAAMGYANNHGGFAGRKMEGVYYDVNVANPKESEDQAACAKFTEDNKVFAMYGQTDVLRACAEKAGALSLTSGNETETTFKKYPHFVDPIAIRLDRMGPVTVGGLSKAGYFSGKLGLVTWDDPNYRYAITASSRPRPLPTSASRSKWVRSVT